MRWLLGCGGLLASAFLLFAIPAALEGPALVPISPGHALSLLDTLALVPLLGAVAILTTGLWRRRQRLSAAISHSPWRASAVTLAAAAGLGLLFASVFPFFWWWAIGAALFTVALAAVTRASVRDRRDVPEASGRSETSIHGS